MVVRSMLDRIVEGLRILSDRRGSSARELLAFVRGSYETPPRNLTMQVHRALKNGVADGSLRHICGRYKLTINPELFKQKDTREKVTKKPRNEVVKDKKLENKKRKEVVKHKKLENKKRNEVVKDKHLENKKRIKSVEKGRSKRRERERRTEEENRKWRRDRKRGKEDPGERKRSTRRTRKSERTKTSRRR